MFRQVPGVRDVTVGYTGGRVSEPDYHQVCTGVTGHAEAVEVIFDPETASYEDLLKVFWHCHDPTRAERRD